MSWKKEEPKLARIRACYQLRALRGRRDLGLWLGRADVAALAVLERFFDQPSGRRDQRRLDCSVPTCFRIDAKNTQDGTISNVSASGAWVETACPLPAGTRLTLR